MKVGVVKITEDLKRIVLLTKQFTSQIEVDSFEEIKKDKKVKVIITEQGELTAADIMQLRQGFPEHKLLILTNRIEPFFEKSCIVHDVLLISKEMVERERLDAIQSKWFDLEEQTEFHNVIALHGTHRSIGVTQVALSTGYFLGTLNYKTLVIGMNPYNPGEYPGLEVTYSFEQIYDFIESNVIHDGESLLPYLNKVEQFYYLVGNRDLYKAVQFNPEPIEKLIRFAKEYFHIVILDVGAFYDSFLAKTGLQMSNTHVLVSTQEQQSIDEYKRWKEQILDRFTYHPKSQYQVINKHASKAIITTKHLEDKHLIPVLAEIPFFPEAADAVITDGIIYLAEYKPFVRSIEGLAKALANEVTESQKPAKKGFMSYLKGGFR